MKYSFKKKYELSRKSNENDIVFTKTEMNTE